MRHLSHSGTAVREDRDHRGERGAYLIEVLLATVVIISVLGAVLTMSLQHSRIRALDDEIHLAFVASRNNLERLRVVPFSQLAALDGTGFDVAGRDGSPGGLTAPPGDSDGLPGEFTITPDKTESGETLYTVRVAVAWRGSHGLQNFELSTLFAERKVE